MAEWQLMYGGASETPGVDRARSNYAGVARTRGEAISRMMETEPFEVPDLLRAIFVARADLDPAGFTFDSRPFGGVIKYWFERTDG